MKSLVQAAISFLLRIGYTPRGRKVVWVAGGGVGGRVQCGWLVTVRVAREQHGGPQGMGCRFAVGCMRAVMEVVVEDAGCGFIEGSGVGAGGGADG